MRAVVARLVFEVGRGMAGLVDVAISAGVEPVTAQSAWVHRHQAPSRAARAPSTTARIRAPAPASGASRRAWTNAARSAGCIVVVQRRSGGSAQSQSVYTARQRTQ